jgi:valyl-tRNA synthetase
MGIRNLRKEKNIAIKVNLDLKIKVNNGWSNKFDGLILKMGNLNDIEFVNQSISGAFSFVVKNNEFFVPFNEFIDTEQEINKLKSEIEDRKGFLNSILKKINNEKFMSNAPEKVVQLELKKKNDAESQIKILEERVINLSS